MALRVVTKSSTPLPSQPQSDEPLWDEVPDEFTRRCVLMEEHGPTDTGRTTFALTAPGPMAYIHTYEKVDGLLSEAKRKGKEIRPCKIGGVMRGSTDEVMLLASRAMDKLERAIADAYDWEARSIILDNHVEGWAIAQLARLGSLNRDERKADDNRKGQLVYAEINARWRSIFKEFRVQADLHNRTNLILIGQTTAEYKKIANSNSSQATGKMVAAGMKETGYLCDVQLKMARSKDDEFSATILKPWWNGAVRGLEITGEMLNFPDVMGMITETDASEWS